MKLQPYISSALTSAFLFSWYPAHRRPWTEIHILAIWGLGGVGGDINVHVYLAYTRGCYAAATSLGLAYIVDATLLLRYWAWVRWGGILTFMYLGCIVDHSGCYTLLLRHWAWVGWGGI